MHTFEWQGNKLYHYINGELRAVVAAEHVDDYKAAITDEVAALIPADPDAAPAPAKK